MSWVFGPGGGSTTTPGGADQDIQFNNNGSFSGSNLLTTDGSGSLSASTHVSASTFYGDGSNLTGVTASAVQVADGPQYSLQFRFDSPVSGDLSGSSDLLWDPATSDVLISGSVRLQDGEEFYGDLEGAILFPAKVDEVGGIGKGKVVYIKGLSGTTPTIGLAACDDPATMPAFGLCAVSASNNANTQVATFGSLDGLNLNNISPGHSFSEGDILYVNTGSGGTAGTFTNVKPTGSNNLVQNIGKVVRNGVSSNGQIKVGGAGRANDTPNLDKGHIFVGNETDQAIQDSTIFVSASAERVGINITVPTAALHVSASSVHHGESARFEGEVVITSPEGKLAVQDTTNNYQVTLVPAAIPRVAFGTTSNETQYMVIDGGNTNRFITVNDFFIGTSSVYSQGLYYDVSEERIGINTSAPTHDLTVNGDLSATDVYISSIPDVNRVLVSTTNGQITTHSPFTFASDVLFVPTITASVGIDTVEVQTETLEVSSSDNGSINIGEGISYLQSGVDRFEIFENEFKFQNVKLYQGVSTENTSNFNIGDKQVFLVDTNSSVVTGTLPGVTSTDDVGITYTVKDSGGNAGTNDIVIEPSGSQTIDGASAAKIQTNYGAMTVVSFSSSVNGFGWGIVSAT
jgi:hypothetical protein